MRTTYIRSVSVVEIRLLPAVSRQELLQRTAGVSILAMQHPPRGSEQGLKSSRLLACCVLCCARGAVTAAERFRCTSCRLPALPIGLRSWGAGRSPKLAGHALISAHSSEGSASPCQTACSCSTSTIAGRPQPLFFREGTRVEGGRGRRGEPAPLRDNGVVSQGD